MVFFRSFVGTKAVSALERLRRESRTGFDVFSGDV